MRLTFCFSRSCRP